MGKKKKILFGLLGVLLAAGAAALIYVNTYYRAGEEASAAAEKMAVQNDDLYLEGDNGKGFIIYPGGKVEENAYAVLAEKLHEKGYTAVIAKMPFRLSILNNNKAQKIIDAHPNVSQWYLIGHSLGGTSASIFADKYPDLVDGIIFLGSYAYKDLSETDLEILVIEGTNDEVLNKEKAEEAELNYPETTEVVRIEGGNHSGFGCYGHQGGDGEAEISWQEQHEEVIGEIINMIERK